MIVDEFHR